MSAQASASEMISEIELAREQKRSDEEVNWVKEEDEAASLNSLADNCFSLAKDYWDEKSENHDPEMALIYIKEARSNYDAASRKIMAVAAQKEARRARSAAPSAPRKSAETEDEPTPDKLCSHVASGVSEMAGGVILRSTRGFGEVAIGMCQRCLDRSDALGERMTLENSDFHYENRVTV